MFYAANWLILKKLQAIKKPQNEACKCFQSAGPIFWASCIR